MVNLNVEQQLASAVVHCAHNVGPQGEAIFQLHFYVIQVFVFMAKNGLIDSDF